MGLEAFVTRAAPDCALAPLLELLAARGLPSTVMMLDSQLCMPGATLPSTWSDARLRTPAGTVSLKRRPGGIAVLVFGNADESLLAAQHKIADALRDLPAAVAG